MAGRLNGKLIAGDCQLSMYAESVMIIMIISYFLRKIIVFTSVHEEIILKAALIQS